MLGVLLAAARPGQRTPGLRLTVNLAACGLVIRARRVLSWLAGPWQDALAVVSLIVPVLMLVFAALVFAVTVEEAVDQAAMVAVPVWRLLSFVPLLGGPAMVMTGWLAVVLLGLAGRPRAAAAIASIPLALSLLNVLVDVMQLSGVWSGGLPLFLVGTGLVTTVVMSSLAVCSLAFSAGPRRGLAIVGRRRACLMVAGISGGFVLPAVVQLVRPGSLAASAFSLLGVLAIAVAVAVTTVRSTVDRRVAVLVALGLLLYLANGVPLADNLAAAVLMLVSLLAAALVWLVAIASRSRRGRRASSAG
jgi:hypothetical protein